MVLEMLQASQKQIAELEVNMKEQVNFKILITKKDYAINVMQQYLRRDCIEIQVSPLYHWIILYS